MKPIEVHTTFILGLNIHSRTQHSFSDSTFILGLNIHSRTQHSFSDSTFILLVAALLLEKGASVDLQDKTGQTALILASENGHLEVVKQLLEKGARIDLKAINGNTALMLAKEKGHHDIAAVLQSQ